MKNEELPNLAGEGRRVLAAEIATRQTDPQFYAMLAVLPNPDRVLRKLGKSQEVFDDIYGDAHVIGELRSIRSALVSYEYRLQPGSDDPASLRAQELCESMLAEPPSPGMQWYDIIWSMGCAVFRGHAIHEVVWQRFGNEVMPVKILDRPQRRFRFGSESNELRLLTKDNMINGEPLGDRKWLVTRHMHSFDNPYGVAVFSACFWPYVFKHSGMKFFAKFSERYGLPWVIGKYPVGTPQPEIDHLVNSLAQMVEDGVAAVPSDGSVELLETKHSGQLVHERLLAVCNREMSKALTSQTLASELTDVGARAASETHRERETTVNQSDRAIIEATMNQLLRWITEVNVAGAKPPTFEFYEEAEARKEMVDSLTGALNLVDLSKREVYERLQLTPPEDEDDIIVSRDTTPAPAIPPQEFSRCPHCHGAHDFASDDDDDDPITQLVKSASTMADDALSLMPEPARKLLDEIETSGGTLADFQARLPELWTAIDETRVGELSELAVMAGFLQGVDEG